MILETYVLVSIWMGTCGIRSFVPCVQTQVLHQNIDEKICYDLISNYLERDKVLKSDSKRYVCLESRK